MNIGVSNWSNWSFDLTNMKFFLYFSSLHDFWPPSTWNSLLHTSWGNGTMWKTCFSAPQNAKKKNQLKH